MTKTRTTTTTCSEGMPTLKQRNGVSQPFDRYQGDFSRDPCGKPKYITLMLKRHQQQETRGSVIG